MKFFAPTGLQAIRWITLIGLLLSLIVSGCGAPQPEQAAAGQPAQTNPQATKTTQTIVKAEGAVATDTAQPPANDQPTTGPAPAGSLDGPLSMVIVRPADNATVNDSPVEISGQADPETVISINDVLLLVPENGQFSVQVALVDGINLIEIVASDINENQEVFYLTVDYERQP